MTGRVLVTGGAGFIGSHLVDALLEQGDTVTVLDDLSTGAEANLREVIGRAGLRVIRGSVLDPAIVDRLVADAETVYHLAAAVGVRNIVARPLDSLITNVRGTEIVFEAAFRHGVRVLLASTSEVYGKSDQLPFRETGDRVLGPTWVHRWGYATSKAIDEHLAFAYADRGLRVSVVRYFNAYGPRIDEQGYGSVIARFAGQALRGEPLTVHGDGQQSRCFTFVSDTVRGTILAGTRDEALGQVLNIGRGAEVTIADLAERVRRIIGSRSAVTMVPYESYYPKGFEDTRRRVPDTTRASELLGFTAAVDLDDGLARTLEWCRAHYGKALAS